MSTTDYLSLARRTTREAFVAGHPMLFLVGRGDVDRPGGARSTMVFEVLDLTASTAPPPQKTEDHHDVVPIVLAIKKVQPTFPTMITIGRTGNNDLVVPDVSVSKFHAFFRAAGVGGERLELSDAGSRNGTWVAHEKLVPRGAAVLCTLGDQITIAKLAFMLLDAGRLWDRARARLDTAAAP